MTGDHRHPKIPMDQVLANELEIVGSHGMQAHKYPEMLQLIENGVLLPEKLVHKTISLGEVPKLLPQMNQFNHTGVLIVNSF